MVTISQLDSKTWSINTDNDNKEHLIGTHTMELALVPAFGFDVSNYLIWTSQFPLEISCEYSNYTYPYESNNSTRCSEFDRCKHNFKTDRYGNTCSNFDSCLEAGSVLEDEMDLTACSKPL